MDDGRTWSSYNDNIPGMTTLDLTMMGDTLYTVGYEMIELPYYWSGFGVMKRSVYPAGIPTNNHHKSDMSVTPNPARDFITLQFQGNYPSTIQYSIYSISGTLLKSGYTKTD